MTERHAYIVEDDAALSRTISRMISELCADTVAFDSAEAFLDGYSKRPIGCVLLDMRLPGMNGLELLSRIAEKPPPNPVIMLSGHGDIPSAVRAVKMGAIDFLQKPFRKDELLELVTAAFEKVDSTVSSSRAFESLTPRERDVLAALADGAANKIVAHRLGLSPRTVEMHRARVFRKLGVNNLTQALLSAREGGFIS